MDKLIIPIIVFVCAFVTWPYLAWADAPKPQFQIITIIQPDKSFQGKVEALMRASQARDQQAYAKLLFTMKARIIGGSRAYRVHIARQLILLKLTSRDNIARGRMVDFLFRELYIGPISSFYIEALVPYIDSKNNDLKSYVINTLNLFDHADWGALANYGMYLDYLSSHAEAPRFVLYLYGHNPNKAFILLSRVRGKKKADAEPSLLLAQHIVADALWKQQYGFLPKDKVEPEAAKQLALMAKRPEWWARLYAATIMKQHSAFRDPALVKTLTADKNALVRETIASFTKPAATQPGTQP